MGVLYGKMNWCFTPVFNLIWLYNVYGGQFPQLEEQMVPGSESATFR